MRQEKIGFESSDDDYPSTQFKQTRQKRRPKNASRLTNEHQNEWIFSSGEKTSHNKVKEDRKTLRKTAKKG